MLLHWKTFRLEEHATNELETKIVDIYRTAVQIVLYGFMPNASLKELIKMNCKLFLNFIVLLMSNAMDVGKH